MSKRWHHAQVRGWKWGWKIRRSRFGVWHPRAGLYSAGVGIATVWLLTGCHRRTEEARP